MKNPGSSSRTCSTASTNEEKRKKHPKSERLLIDEFTKLRAITNCKKYQIENQVISSESQLKQGISTGHLRTMTNEPTTNQTAAGKRLSKQGMRDRKEAA
jgi:hypothetical protein